MHVDAIMVVGDELDRYLVPVIETLSPIVDRVVVYDDQSQDGSLEYCESMGCVVTRRPDDVPSFLEHEGRFRQAAWDAYAALPGPKDWVLAIDSDELLVGGRAELEQVTDGVDAVALPIPEIWEWQDKPMMRVDGFWGGLSAPRLFRYRDGGVFRDRAMACGSVPLYVTEGASIRAQSVVQLLHLGYLLPGDRKAKYSRYTAHPVGHNRTHIESILGSPTVCEWLKP